MLHRYFKALRPDENQAFFFLGPAKPPFHAKRSKSVGSWVNLTTLAKCIDRSIDHNSHSGNLATSDKFFCSRPLAAAPSEKLTRTDSRFVAASDRQYPVMFAPQNRLLRQISQQQ